MTKVTLSNVSSFQNDSSAVAAVNANMAAITTAMDNTLSRDGTSPNPMSSSLDMNNNRILNLPAPTNPTDPVRYQDFVASGTGGGNVLGPSTNTDLNFPRWNGTNTKTLSNGMTLAQLATAIGSGSVTNIANSQLATMAAHTIKGNDTTGSVTPSDLSIIPWTAQLHQNSGGQNSGHNLMWADQNSTITADHLSVYSQDQSVIPSLTIGGSISAGDTVTVTGTINSIAYPVVYTVQSGDTLTTVAAGLAAALNGGSTHATGGAAFNTAMAAYLGSDGLGYTASASNTGAVLVFDFPWASSGNSLAASKTGVITISGSTTISTLNADNGPFLGLARNVPGRTPQSGDQYGSLQYTFASGPSSGLDSGALINLQYLAGGVGTAKTRFLMGATNGALGANVALNVGPAGVALSDTDGSGNIVNCFSNNTYGDPGLGNLSVPGKIFAGIHGQSGLDYTKMAGIEAPTVVRVSGSSNTPTAGAGLEFLWAGGGPGTILSFTRDTSTYLSLQILSSSLALLPSNSATKAITHDSNAFWPQTDNSLPLGKTAQRFSNIFGTTATLGSISLPGSSSGTITIQPQAAAGTFNWNLPITAGLINQPLLSGGGGATAMAFSGISYPTSATSGGIPYFSSSAAITSSAVLASTGIVVGGGGGGAPATVAGVTLTTYPILNMTSSNTQGPQFNFENDCNDSTATQINATKTRAGGNALSGDSIFNFYGIAFANGGTRVCSQFGSILAGSSSGNNIPTKFSFVTSDTAGLLNHTMTFDNTGSISMDGSGQILNATAIPAGGTAGSGYKLSSTSNFGIFFGSSTPTLAAAKGSLYLRSDGSSSSTRMYVNTDGSTTWTSVTTAA